jgi:hypothetical protein
VRRLADTTSPGPGAEAWEILVAAVDEAHEIVAFEDRHWRRAP